ncbi:MAG: LysM domain-containing protein [Gammaproteobacteria bacterium]
MKDYSATRCLTALCLAGLLAACAHAPQKPVAAAAPPPAQPPPQEQPAAPPPAPVMQPQAPRSYVVKKGDTLWGIASMYLQDPWHWPDIWYANSAIKNPHLIYPGDQLMLGYINGRPSLTVVRNGKVVTEATEAAAETTLPTEKLEPQIRYSPLNQAIPAIPLNSISQFITGTRVVSSDELNDAGYLLRALDNRPVIGAGSKVYARGLKQSEGGRYNLFRLGEKYVDPDNGDTLGYEATYIGDGSVEVWGDPSKVLLTATAQEAMAGDRFLAVTAHQLNQNYMPHAPAQPVKGNIISVLGGVLEIGQYQVVVLDRGSDAGLDQGTVLGIYSRGDKVSDSYAFDGLSSSVKLPEEREGTLLVFRTFPKVSYGLVMEAKSEIHLLDVVKNPAP